VAESTAPPPEPPRPVATREVETSDVVRVDGRPREEREEREFARRAVGRSGLDPAFAARMVPKLSQAVTYMMTSQRAQLLEMRCEARACVVRVLWPARRVGEPARTPAVLAPEEPGCAIDMQPPFEEQLQAPGPTRVSFYYQCPDWVEPAFETQELPDVETNLEPSQAEPTPPAGE